MACHIDSLPNPNVHVKGTYNIIMTIFICGMSHRFTPQPKCSRERRYNITLYYEKIYIWQFTLVHSKPKFSNERHLQHYHDNIYIWHVTLVHSQTQIVTWKAPTTLSWQYLYMACHFDSLPNPHVRVKGTYNIIITRFIYETSHLFIPPPPPPKRSRKRRLQHYHDKMYKWQMMSVHTSSPNV